MEPHPHEKTGHALPPMSLRDHFELTPKYESDFPMKPRTFFPLVLAALVVIFTGCQTYPRRQTDSLQQSIRAGNTAEALQLIQEGKDIDKPDQSGLTPLCIAVERGDAAVVRALIAKGANVNQAVGNSGTVLTLACSTGNRAIVEALMNAGAKPDAGALIAATRSHDHEGASDVVDLVLSRRAEFHLQADDLNNALYWAAWEGNLPVVKLLLAHNADPNAQMMLGKWKMMTALHAAVESGQKAVCAALIDAGAQINAKDSDWQDPLELAISIPQLGPASALVNAGATFAMKTNTVEERYYSGIYQKLLADKQAMKKQNVDAKENYVSALTMLTAVKTEYVKKATTDSKKAKHDLFWHAVLAAAAGGVAQAAADINSYNSYRSRAQMYALAHSSTMSQYDANFDSLMAAYRPPPINYASAQPVNYTYPHPLNNGGMPANVARDTKDQTPMYKITVTTGSVQDKVARLRAEANLLTHRVEVCQVLIGEIQQIQKGAPDADGKLIAEPVNQ